MTKRVYGSNVPQARKDLAELACDMRDAGFPEWADQVEHSIIPMLCRSSPSRRASVKSSPVTPAQRRRIIRLALHTDMYLSEIASEVKVNPGRVSEVLTEEGLHD